MFPFTSAEITAAVGGELIQGNPEQSFTVVSTDTRIIEPGCLFVALRGERFDAHNFLAQAIAQGAAGLLVSTADLAGLAPTTAVILVADTLQALQMLGQANRRKAAIPVVGVTGSVGKTSTKDMIAAVLGEKYLVHKTGGNYNNEIGLPLTLLGIEPQHQVAVVEMGMRGLGEIKVLAEIAEPNFGVISNIGETHIELLGSVAKIATAKGELLDALPADGCAILNGDDPWLQQLGSDFKGKVIYYGFGEHNDVRAQAWQNVGAQGITFQLTLNAETWPVQLPVWGKHNVLNALAASAVGLELGLTPQEISCGLTKVTLSAMRLQINTDHPWVVINDAYNANPASAKAALEVLADYPCPGKRIAVLANMLELGSEAENGHRSVGAAAAGLELDLLITLGDLAAWIAEEAQRQGMPSQQVIACQDKASVVELLQQCLQPGDVLLVKGSRGMKMEELLLNI